MKGICHLTFIPIRSENKSSSEMISSLIFGETYKVLEQKDDWYLIKTDFDNYEGWISAFSYCETFESPQIVNEIWAKASNHKETFFIPCGGLVPENLSLKLNEKEFKVVLANKNTQHLPQKLRIQNLAHSFLNTPYLWGGRTFMGIDCSGLVQVIFKTENIHLPRDTSQQILTGKDIELNELNTGDLVFFAEPNKEKVSHVGIMVNEKEIIHASIFVRKDILNPEGIFINGKHRYKILNLKRIID